MVLRLIHDRKYYRWGLNIWLVTFTVVTMWLVHHALVESDKAHDLAKQVKTTQLLIQQGRLNSCKTTYRSLKEVFSKFEPPPKLRTETDNRNIQLFNNIIASKIANCRNQIAPPPPRRK